MQSEKHNLEAQLTQKAADADALQSELQKYAADHQDLTQILSSTQAELRSSVEQTHRTEEQLLELTRVSEAQEAEAAAELEGAKSQAGQMARQLSERMQRLDALQVHHTLLLLCSLDVQLRKRGHPMGPSLHCSHGAITPGRRSMCVSCNSAVMGRARPLVALLNVTLCLLPE